jgi:hypothetical protein
LSGLTAKSKLPHKPETVRRSSGAFVPLREVLSGRYQAEAAFDAAVRAVISPAALARVAVLSRGRA